MKQDKKLKYIVKLNIEAGKAVGGPPISSILGNYKVNSNEFCKEFNSKTVSFKEGTLLGVIIYIYENKSYDYIIKTPTASFFIKKLAELEKGCSDSEYISYISLEQLYELLKIKKKEFMNLSEYSLLKILISNCYSSGILII